MALGHRVVVFDNLSRPGAHCNLDWLQAQGRLETVEGDVRDAAAVEALVVRRFDAVIHLAAQVAVTTSIQDPRADFEHNALGTLNVLEAVRRRSPGTVVLHSSTNKVYGLLANLAVEECARRYAFRDLHGGVAETQALQFHSPYGCSKGAADQYVADYARVYGLRAVNLRQSCIYGPRQFGVEDQGWVAWFVIAHLTGQPITVYGNGKQVRDLLEVGDLVNCYLAAIESADRISGMTFNVGGGPRNTLSILELFEWLEATSGRPVTFQFGPGRRGDQAVYVSDVSSIRAVLGWEPHVDLAAGLKRLYEWVREMIATGLMR
jgi:CDP-paratose 2-epimerase